ncbi:MAG: phosphate/phosphite/phosphonate ABC transporter substrate-binding protein [Actinomycetota bacterium]
MARPTRLLCVLLTVLALAVPGTAARADDLSFGVLTQRSPVLTAQYWNPILDYVARKSGVKLALKVPRTAPEANAAIAAGEYDFTYSNKIFNPRPGEPAYRVVARPDGPPIRGQIVTLADSPIRSLDQLAGREVGFPSVTAFVGYGVPMDHLIRAGVHVTPVFGGNQEGIMAQLKLGKVIAAGVNDQVMREFASREKMEYRVLWQSQPYHNLAIAVHPRVAKATADAVQRTLAGMSADPEGMAVLQASAALVGQASAEGFVAASPKDYANYEDFYRNMTVKDFR